MLSENALVSWETVSKYLSGGGEYLGEDDQAWAEPIINAVSERANTMTGRRLASREYTVTLDGTGTDIVMLPEWPVSEVEEVSINGVALDSADYSFYEDGRLYIPAGTPATRQCIDVTYTAGYDPVPWDLQMAVIEAVAYTWKRLRSRALGTSSITADGVTTQFEIDIPIPAKRVFEAYRGVTV